MLKVNFIFLLITALSFLSLNLNAGIEITQSVKQFKYPRFSKSGFIEWVLRGDSGSYDNAIISVKDLDLRLYSGDVSTNLMCEVSSGFALLDTEKGISESEESISIVGKGFSITGSSWMWDSDARVILIKDKVFVKFDQNIDALFTEDVGALGTQIKSDYLELSIEPTRYTFEFKDTVTLESEAVYLLSNHLSLELKNNASKQNDLSSMGEVSSMELIEGSGNIQLLVSGKEINSEAFEIYPQKDLALFQGDAEITVNNVFLKGSSVAFDQSDIKVESDEGNDYCTLSITTPMTDSDSSLEGTEFDDVFIKSKEIMFSKTAFGYDFIFEKEVFYRSNLYLIISDWLRVQTHKLSSFEHADFNQSITQSEARGSVIVEHANFKIRSDSMLYLPPEDKLEISGNVFYQNDLTHLKSDELLLLEGSIYASSEDELVEVLLPYSHELGFSLSEDPKMLDKLGAASSTVITAGEFRLNTRKGSDECYFSKNVTVARGDFNMTSDRLNINWINPVKIIESHEIKSVLAEGSVAISENLFSAKSDKARITPNDELIELIGNAQLKDSTGSIWGDHINFDRKLQKTEVVGASEGQRARIQFDLSDFGLEDKAEDVLEEK